jgi:hypothetical protein
LAKGKTEWESADTAYATEWKESDVESGLPLGPALPGCAWRRSPDEEAP